MEEKKEQVAVHTAAEEKKAPLPLPSYTAKELAEAHKQQFDCRKEVVTAALLCAGKKTATIREAKAIVAAFKKKEVK